MAGLTIGETARRASVPASTIRYYERIGLLTPAARSDSGYRLYSERAVDEMRFIKRAQTLGFTLTEIGDVLKVSRAGVAPCEQVIALARSRLKAIESQLNDLAAFHARLTKAVQTWDGACGFSTRGLCDLMDGAEVARMGVGPPTPSGPGTKVVP